MPHNDKVGEPSTLPEPTREEKSAAWNWLKQYALSGIGDARQAYVALWEWTELKKASTASAELRCVDMIGCRQGQPCLQERFAASSDLRTITEVVGQDGKPVAAPCAISGCQYSARSATSAIVVTDDLLDAILAHQHGRAWKKVYSQTYELAMRNDLRVVIERSLARSEQTGERR